MSVFKKLRAAKFFDSEKRPFGVYFQDRGHYWEMTFGDLPTDDASPSFDSTGYGDSRRVLSTIVATLMDFISTVRPNYIRFTGSTESGKAKLYRMMVKRIESKLEKIGYSASHYTPFSNPVKTDFTIGNTEAIEKSWEV